MDENLMEKLLEEIAHYRKYDHGPKDMLNIRDHLMTKFGISREDALAGLREYRAIGGDRVFINV